MVRVTPDEVAAWNARALAKREDRARRAEARAYGKARRHATRLARIAKNQSSRSEIQPELPIDTPPNG